MRQKLPGSCAYCTCDVPAGCGPAHHAGLESTVDCGGSVWGLFGAFVTCLTFTITVPK